MLRAAHLAREVVCAVVDPHELGVVLRSLHQEEHRQQLLVCVRPLVPEPRRPELIVIVVIVVVVVVIVLILPSMLWLLWLLFLLCMR